MTLKALLNLAGFHKGPLAQMHTHLHPYEIVDRYHGDYHDHHEHHGWHGSKGKGGGGGGAALSALTLLAFLFLINVMQQSLMENNATETTTAATIFLREDQQAIQLSSRFGDHSIEKDVSEDTNKKEGNKKYVKIKSSK